MLEAQSALILDEDGGPQRDVARARAAFGELATTSDDSDPAAVRAGRRALDAADDAVRAGDEVALAAAGGTVRAAVFRLSYASTLAATRRGDAAAAKGWMLVREFRTATKFTRPGADGTLALRSLGRKRISPTAATTAVSKDLLDAYQARLRELLVAGRRGEAKNLPARRAEAAARAQGYFTILAPRYEQDRGPAETGKARAAFARLAATSERGGPAFTAALTAASATQDGFTAAPLSEQEAGRRAQQLLRFIKLVPVEYGRGVSGGAGHEGLRGPGGRRVPRWRDVRVRRPRVRPRQA